MDKWRIQDLSSVPSEETSDELDFYREDCEISVLTNEANRGYGWGNVWNKIVILYEDEVDEEDWTRARFLAVVLRDALNKMGVE